MKSREDFYGNMVWVVDGTRLPMDYRRFSKGSKNFGTRLRDIEFNSSIWNGLYSTYFPEECLPKRWLNSSVPVYFDFQGIHPDKHQDETKTPLWCLFPGEIKGWSVIGSLYREKFDECALEAPELLLAQDIRSQMEERGAENERDRERVEFLEKQRAEAFQQFLTNPGRSRYRRFKQQRRF